METLCDPAIRLRAKVNTMRTELAQMLAVSDGSAAIDFYKAAFGAELLWDLVGGAWL